MFDAPVTLAHITDTSGIATHSIIMGEDDLSPQETPMVHAPALFEGLVVMPLNLSWNTREDWYTHTEDDDDPARTLHAWESFTDRHDKPADVFLRWLTIFHPLIPAVHMNVQTGYSQGDSVDLVSWSLNQKTAGDDRPIYLHAAAEHERIVNALEFIGAHTRGQYVSLALYELQHSLDDIADGEASYTLDPTHVETISGIHYTEEFEPELEALNYARGMWREHGRVEATKAISDEITRRQERNKRFEDEKNARLAAQRSS